MGALLLVGCVMALAVAAGLYWIGDAQREILRLLLWEMNGVPVLVSVMVVVMFFLPAPLVASGKQRVRWLTDEHKQVVEDRRVRKAARSTKVQFACMAPMLAVLLPGLFLWVVVVWVGFPLYRFPDVPELELVSWVPQLVDGLETYGNPWNTWAIPFMWAVDVGVFWMPIAPYWEKFVESRTGIGTGKLPDPGEYQMKQAGRRARTDWRPWPTMMLGAREYASSREFEPDVQIPSWVEYGGKKIFGGLLIFGQKGSGKTSLIKRAVEDIIRFRASNGDYKPALVAIDPKGDLSDFIEQVAAECGRSEDVVRLGVGTDAKWNPFANLGPNTSAQDAKQAGYFLRCAMSTGSSDNAYWDDNADNLLTYSIHLLALSGVRLGFDSLSRWVTTLKDGDEEHRTEQYLRAAENLQGLFEGAVLDDRMLELDATRCYFEEEFINLDSKPRTIIINVATNFLRKFEALVYSRSFSCDADEPGHFEGFPELIRRGRIFVLDVRSTENGAISGAMAMLVKLYYQAAVKQRDRYEPDWKTRDVRRITATIWDEYQSYVTTSGSGKQGDAEYLETSRSFYAVDIAATQQFSSIAAAVGGQDSSAQRVVGSFNNLVTFLHNDPALTKYLQQLVGRREREELRLSVSEGLQGAERDYLGTLREGSHSVNQQISVGKKLEERLPTELFAQLKAFEAIGLFTDAEGRKLVRFCSKPHFVPVRMRHEEVVKVSMEEGKG